MNPNGRGGQKGRMRWEQALLEKVLPDCRTALELAQTGIERPLYWGERVRLRYHSVLCLYCQCSRERFERCRHEMEEAEQRRRVKTTTHTK